MTKIAIIGSSGSGKSTTAARISEAYNIRLISMDDVIFKDGNFSEKPPTEIYQKWILDEIKDKDDWVIEGVYPKVADVVWPLADVLIWLDLPFEIVRDRYEKRDKKRNRSGPFSDITIHQKEYDRLQREYTKSIKELQLSNILRVTLPDVDVVAQVRTCL